MKKSLALFLPILGILGTFSCEKDDICIDANTPLLIIRFYDQADTTALKEVPQLTVRGLRTATDTLAVYGNASLDSIAIPLRTDQGSTTFLISQKAGDEVPTNYDMLTLSYTVRDAFASRACGFVARYEDMEGTASSDGDSLWIKEIQIVTPVVENSTGAHVKIFH